MRRVTWLFLVLAFGMCSPAQNTPREEKAVQLFDQAMNKLHGSSESRDYGAAAELFRSSAQLGYAPAQVVLGYFYQTGSGLVVKDAAVAVSWYKRAAQQDDPLGEWLLGRMIFSGEGTLRDLQEATVWLQKAAGHGDPFAELLLGRIELELGSYDKAADWFRKAAKQGLPQAQFQLGELLREGRGTVKQDKFEAYIWLLAAAEGGYRRPETYNLQALEADLGSTRVESAKTQAREWAAKYSRAVVGHGCTGWDGEFELTPAAPPIDIQQFCR